MLRLVGREMARSEKLRLVRIWLIYGFSDSVSTMRLTLAWLTAAILPLVGTSQAVGQLSIDGSLRTYQGFRANPAGESLVNRSNLDLSLTLPGRVRSRADVSAEYDAASGSDLLRVREAYADLRFRHADVRAGRFGHSFGRAEGLLFGDIFHTYDLSEFLTRDAEDLRTGIDGIRIGGYAGPNAVKLLLSPFRSRSRGPQGDWSVVPDQVSFIPIIDASETDRTLAPGPLNAALQIEWRPRLDLDVDLLVARWHHPLPAYRKQVTLTDTPFGPVPTEVRIRETAVTGFKASVSAEYRITPIVALTTEVLHNGSQPVDILPDAATVDALRDENPNGFLRTVPHLSGLFGAKTVWGGATLSAQTFIEHRLREPADALGERTIGGVTASAWRRFRYDDILIRVFGRYQGKPGSWWVQPEGLYRVNDRLQVRLGAHWFGGDPSDDAADPTFTFDRYRQNRFVYGKFRYSW